MCYNVTWLLTHDIAISHLRCKPFRVHLRGAPGIVDGAQSRATSEGPLVGVALSRVIILRASNWLNKDDLTRTGITNIAKKLLLHCTELYLSYIHFER